MSFVARSKNAPLGRICKARSRPEKLTFRNSEEMYYFGSVGLSRVRIKRALVPKINLKNVIAKRIVIFYDYHSLR